MKNMMKVFAAIVLAMALILSVAAFAEGEEEIVEAVEVVETAEIEETVTDEEPAVIEEELEIVEVPAEFTGSVKVILTCAEELFYGDIVTLTANVTDANMDYTLRWEANTGAGWQQITGENDEVLSFELNEGNAIAEYRVVVVVG